MVSIRTSLWILAGGATLIWRASAGEPSASAPQPASQPMVKLRFLDEQGRLQPAKSVPKVIRTDEEWRRQLTAEQYRIARGKGTEPAFCGVFYDHKQPGVYTCVCCQLPLFTSEAKFDSGTGWPSFFAPAAPENVTTRPDLSHGLRRVEVLCARCDAHLGHVFPDGPAPTRMRYCLNSASLVFKPSPGWRDPTRPSK